MERLPEELGTARVQVESGGEHPSRSGSIAVTAGECLLRFRPQAARAVLTEVRIQSDEGGLFFQRVLGPLMVAHGGSLHARLAWDVPERNSHGDFAEVLIQKGQTTYPGLLLMKNVMAPHAAALADDGTSPFEGDAPTAEGAPEEPLPESLVRELRAEQAEIDRLLEEGRRFFAEYQRLKAQLTPAR